jgi:hypothetical protein
MWSSFVSTKKIAVMTAETAGLGRQFKWKQILGMVPLIILFKQFKLKNKNQGHLLSLHMRENFEKCL